MAKRRQYTEEYKREAVNLTLDPNVTVVQIAQELGISPTNLAKWRKQYLDKSSNQFPGRGNARDQEIATLKRELNRVKKERDFLKDAAVFFAKESK
jgi:transposase